MFLYLQRFMGATQYICRPEENFEMRCFLSERLQQKNSQVLKKVKIYFLS